MQIDTVDSPAVQPHMTKARWQSRRSPSFFEGKLLKSFHAPVRVPAQVLMREKKNSQIYWVTAE